MDLNYLVIEGNIGAGKTTLAQMIAEKYQAKLVLEKFADNPFLPKFYENQHQYSFPLEMAFLAERYNQLNRELSHFELFSSFTVSDYYFMKSLIFAQNTLQTDEYNLYRQFFTIIYDRMPKPDLYVYLHKEPDLLLQNIAKRGRSYETYITKEYLEKITQGYFNFFRQQREIRILVIDTNGIDFVKKPEDFEKITETIFSQKFSKGVTRILLD
ncbi:MAG TPA: deoxynucleoside kinase [Prolixibacteraceae bacterium]|mgnify:FL=1|jgi:deoxyadenosine/deoxycytidine kinase|nr:deoxynucleoside kinase [Prolixibacteraceae bacterium]HPR85885.1 deoxynucleoside kinase [Prolixibacteraceae bacterium]